MPPVPKFVLRYCAIFSLASAVTAFQPAQAQTQAIQPSQTQASQIQETSVRTAAPRIAQIPEGDLRPLAQGNSLLSVEGGRRLMTEANDAVGAQNYDMAEDKLKSARQVFNQVSNFYGDLAAAFTGIDSRVSGEQRDKAVEAAQMRDEATYQLALVHRAKNEPDLAVPLLVQIIRSQNPTQDLGQRAYQQLFELGFVNVQYPRS